MISNVFGTSMRTMGQALERWGVVLQGKNAYVDRLMPSTRVVAVGAKSLKHGLEGFVAPTSNVVGDVEMGEQASVWYGACVHGDSNKVTIGRGSCVQDRAVVDASAGPVKIGNDVSIGAAATVASCTISDGVLVGPGATIMEGAHIGTDVYIDGGAVVDSNTRIPAGELWTGSPATKLRNLTDSEIAYLRASAQHTAQSGELHFQQSIKTRSDLADQVAEREFRAGAFMKWDAPLPVEREELVQYNRLSYNPHDVGIFRAQDHDEEAEWDAVEALDDASDVKVDAEAAEYVVMDRVSDAVSELLSAHPSRHADIKAALRDRDAAAADILDDMMSRVDEAVASPDAAAELEAIIQQGRPTFSVRAAAAE